MRIDKFIISICIVIMFTACGNASKSSETTLSSNDVSISDSTSKSESDETVKYEYKSTEELLKNSLNRAGNGFVAVNDKNDIPDFINELLVPFHDDEYLWGYKTIKGDVVLEPQFDTAYDFDNNQAAIVYYENGESTVIDSKGNNIIPIGDYTQIITEGGIINLYDGNDGVERFYDYSGNELSLEEFYQKFYSGVNDINKLNLRNNFANNENGNDNKTKKYLPFSEGYLPFETKSGVGMLDANCNIVKTFSDSNMITCRSNGYFGVGFMGDVNFYDTDFNCVTETLDIGLFRPKSSVVYPGGYTYIYYADEIFVIKIAPELYEEVSQ